GYRGGVRSLLVGCAMWCAVVLPLVGCSKPDGTACQSDGECAVASRCVYRILDGCTAARTCQPNPTGPTCNLVASYCGCDGTIVGVGCHLAPGYARVPVVGPDNGSCQSADGGGQD